MEKTSVDDKQWYVEQIEADTWAVDFCDSQWSIREEAEARAATLTARESLLGEAVELLKLARTYMPQESSLPRMTETKVGNDLKTITAFLAKIEGKQGDIR